MRAMLNKLKKKINYFLRTWRVKANDTIEIELPYGTGGDTECITLSGSLYKAFTDVELEIYFIKQWPNEILILFYAAVVELYSMEELDENNMRMFLHPEAYEGLEFITQEDSEDNNTNIV